MGTDVLDYRRIRLRCVAAIGSHSIDVINVGANGPLCSKYGVRLAKIIAASQSARSTLIAANFAAVT